MHGINRFRVHSFDRFFDNDSIHVYSTSNNISIAKYARDLIFAMRFFRSLFLLFFLFYFISFRWRSFHIDLLHCKLQYKIISLLYALDLLQFYSGR